MGRRKDFDRKKEIGNINFSIS